MPPFKDPYTEHQIKRWMRPDAHHFVRPDWRRHVKPGSEAEAVFELYESKYRPDQARVPAGSREGGRWTNEESTAGHNINDTIELSAAAPKGHHEVPRAVYKKLNLPDETRKVFDDATTGPVPTRGHLWDDAHRKYNEAVGKLMDNYLLENKIQPGQMTPEQAQEFLKAVRESPNPAIREYNMRIRMLQYLYRPRAGPMSGGTRGNE